MQSVATLGPPHLSDELTLEAWSNEYLGFSVHLKPKTGSATRACCGRASCRPSARCQLDAIDGLAIRRWVAEMHAEGLSASRIQQSYRLLSQMLASAVDCGLLERNPSHGVKLPRDVRSEMACLTAEEVERLADACPPATGP